MRHRFRSEYLGQLSRKRPQGASDRVPRVGEIVLLGSDNTKRLNWPLARVINVIPGKDNKVRVVRLKTALGELVRPIQRVYPLEISSPVPAEQIKRAKEKKVDLLHKSKPMSEIRFVDKQLIKETSVNQKALTRTRSGRLVKAPERL